MANRLYIAKNKYGRYYTIIKNDYDKSSVILTVNLPRNTELESDYGTFECDYYVSCYKAKNDEVKVVINITKLYTPFKQVQSPYETYSQDTPIETPF